jgi:hypothetical protein
METTFLRELNHKISKYSTRYIFSLLITRGQKNCTSMSRELGIKPKTQYRFLENGYSEAERLSDLLIKNALKAIQSDGPWFFVTDDTLVVKKYARQIEKLGYSWGGSSEKCANGISIVVVGITNGKGTLPVAFEYWDKSKKGTPAYKKKTEIAIELVKKLEAKIPIKYHLMDGAYCSQKTMDQIDRTLINS